jgi:hypothetical protein
MYPVPGPPVTMHRLGLDMLQRFELNDERVAHLIAASWPFSVADNDANRSAFARAHGGIRSKNMLGVSHDQVPQGPMHGEMLVLKHLNYAIYGTVAANGAFTRKRSFFFFFFFFFLGGGEEGAASQGRRMGAHEPTWDHPE